MSQLSRGIFAAIAVSLMCGVGGAVQFAAGRDPAYPERFLTGERPEPAFLISKPFQPAMVSAVASQALFFQRNSRNRTPRAAAS